MPPEEEHLPCDVHLPGPCATCVALAHASTCTEVEVNRVTSFAQDGQLFADISWHSGWLWIRRVETAVHYRERSVLSLDDTNPILFRDDDWASVSPSCLVCPPRAKGRARDGENRSSYRGNQCECVADFRLRRPRRGMPDHPVGSNRFAVGRR